VRRKSAEMIKADVMKLFLIIHKTYSVSGFKPGDDALRLELWCDLLKDVPFELAQANLRRYVLDPYNKFPPHPGVLAERPAQTAIGRDVPNAEETRQLLADRDQLLLMGGRPPIPESVREAVRKIGQSADSSR